MEERIIVQYTDSRIVGKTRVDVDAKLQSFIGQKPYFSVTAETYEKKPNGRWDGQHSGMCHEEIRRVFPELAPVIALHLSDEDGAPMHCVENAFYWAGGDGRNELTDTGIDKAVISNALNRVEATDKQKREIFEILGIADAPETEWKRWDCTPNAGILAKHLRIDLDEASAICNSVVAGEMGKAEMSAYVDMLRHLWKKEANDAIELLRALAAKKELTGS